MEKLVAELEAIMPFKNTTETGDIVLIAAKEPQMLLYAQVGEILRDDSRKAEWWYVTLHLLTVPPQTVTWTLRTPQFTGQETFTMGGEGRFIKALALEAAPQTMRNLGQQQESGKRMRKISPPALQVIK